MTIRQLETFLMVAQLKNFTLAAERLGYAQSTVTTQIKQLETELGCALFDRLGKKTALTGEGVRLVAYAKKMTELEREIQRNIPYGNSPSGTLRIGIAESLCYDSFPELLREYKMNCPNVNIQLTFIDHTTFPRLLKNGELDFVYMLNPLFCRKDFEILYQHTESLGFFVCPAHPLLRAKTVTLEDAASYPLLLTGSGCNFRMMLVSALTKQGIFPDVALETVNKEILKNFAAHGMGIAFLPDITAKKDLESGRLCRLELTDHEFMVCVQLMMHKDKIMSPAMQAFVRDFFCFCQRKENMIDN